LNVPAICFAFHWSEFMMPLSQYAKVKDRYCICYLGPSREVVEHLIAIRPHIEKELPGIDVYLACRDKFLYLAEGVSRIIGQSKLVEKKRQFGYIRELKTQHGQNPVESLLLESELTESLDFYFTEINPQRNWKKSQSKSRR
jgi:hypothetical protein